MNFTIKRSNDRTFNVFHNSELVANFDTYNQAREYVNQRKGRNINSGINVFEYWTGNVIFGS